MAYFRCGGGGMPAGLQSGMDAVLNKKFGTSTTYPASGWPDNVNLMGPLPEKTQASASVCSFEDGADDVPTRSLVVTIPATTLSGVSSVTETQTGRNLLPNKSYLVGANTLWLGDDSSPYYQPLKAGTYTVSLDTSETMTILIYENDSWIDRKYNATTATFVIDHDGSFAIQLYKSAGIPVINNWQLEIGSTAHAYEPYQTPTVYTASLGRTIYGGEVDIVNGTGTATWGSVDLGDLSWTYNATYLAFYATVNDKKNGATGYIDIYEQTTYWITSQEWADADDVFYCSGNNKYLAIKNTDYSDAQTFKTAMTGHKFVYEVDTPTDFTFDGQEINSLYGVNNFWNDAGGDTTVVYRRDIDLALQAVSSSRGLMMASRPVTQLVGEESDPDQVNELVEDDEIEQEGEDDAR